MRAAWPHAVVAMTGAILALVWPLSSALSSRDVLQARLAAAALTAVVCAVIALSQGVHRWVWTAASMATAAAGLAVLLSHVSASSTCVASYDNRLVVIGREYTAAAAGYARANPSARDLLLDAGGAADKVWTPASIASCRFWIGWAGPLVAPLLAACVSALVARRTPRFASVRARTPVGPAPVAGRTAAMYDAFVSYRHVDPDKAWAQNIAEVLESHNLRVAIDFRDFEPNEHFLSEMERCIRESRFVLCIVSSRYIDSDHCSEEAIISKTLDLADRRRRLVPLVFERVELPIWLHGLVGIDFTPSAGIDPVERLLALVKNAPGASG
jgi:hypothetical protein